VGNIGLEARPHLLEGFVLIAKESEGRLGAVFGSVGGVQQRIFIARPVEHYEVATTLRQGMDGACADQTRGGKGKAA